jgi:cell division protein FtsB
MNPVKKLYNKIPRFLKNKFLITGIVFLVFIIFLDRNNLISQYKMKKELNGLKKELKYLRDQTAADSARLSRLINDSLQLEKLGREKYLMKRDSEDIYLVVRKTGIKK